MGSEDERQQQVILRQLVDEVRRVASLAGGCLQVQGTHFLRLEPPGGLEILARETARVGVVGQAPNRQPELLQLAGGMHPGVGRDDALDQGGAGAGLAQHKDGRRAVLAPRALGKPALIEGLFQVVEHGDFRGLVVFDGTAPGSGTPGKGLEGIVPVLQVFQLLADRVPVESGRSRMLLEAGGQPRHLADMAVVGGTARPRQRPVSLGAVRLNLDQTPEHRLCGGGIAVVHQVVGEVEHERGVVRLQFIGPLEAGLGAAVFAHLRPGNAEQVLHHGLVAAALVGPRDGGIRLVDLAVGHEQARQLRPGGAVLRVEVGDRGKRLEGRGPV